MNGRAPLSNSLVEQDREHLIHPAVGWAAHERRGARILASGQGAFLTDIEGRTLLDGFSGLWCVNLGYGRSTIVDAACRQMDELPYATGYFHFGSEPAIRLATALAERAPGDLDHVFFTLGGSDAVDSAVRFIRYYNNVRGRPEKKHMIALDRGYHGSSAAGSGLTGLAVFHDNFDAPARNQHHIPAPYAYRLGIDGDALIRHSCAALRAKVDELGAEQVAAFFAEPVLGSGGVIVPPPGWLRAMRDLCTELGILLVADEVITGFARTGPLFACEHESVVPDLMTLAKGLTSGYSPMGAVLLSEEVYRTIADATRGSGLFGHGYTYSAHPVSAAVGLEVLRLYEAEDVVGRVNALGRTFTAQLEALRSHPLVGDIRSKGLLGGIELVADKAGKTRFPAEIGISERLSRLGDDRGLIFRAFGDGIIGLAPPLICSETEIDLLFERLGQILDDLLEQPEIRGLLEHA